jgi:sigma-B regulation protein RsbU (phosphoserine phosphatase)
LRVRLRAGERIVQLEQGVARRNDELETANAQITATNRRMRRDLEAAAKVQRALLPTSLPDFPDAEFAWAFRPCQELAGDILGVVGLDERHAGLYVLDVSGHGVAAALLSVSVRHFLSPVATPTALLRRTVPRSQGVRLVSPGEVLEELNRQFPMEPSTGQFFTLVYGILDLERGELRYVSAGHPPPLHMPMNRQAAYLTASGFPVGIVSDAQYPESTISLTQGDRLYFYSDGVPEAFNEQGAQFGADRLRCELESSRGLPLQRSLDALLATLARWTGTDRPVDDVSVLGVEIGSNGRE